MNKQTIFCVCFSVGLFSSLAIGQQQFELSAPQLGVHSQAVLTEDLLQVTSSTGEITRYRREPRFDSADGDWLGYFDRSARQVLRWPVSNHGNMQIGTLRGAIRGGAQQDSSAVEYRTSQMTIQATGLPADRSSQRPALPSETLVLPPDMAGHRELDPLGDFRRSDLFDAITQRAQEQQAAEMLQLAAFDQGNSPWLLARESGSELRAVQAGSKLANDWWVAPAGAGYVRLETYSRGRVYAVSTTNGRTLALQPLSQDAKQLWKVHAGRGQQNYLLENAFFPGRCLTHLGNGQLALQVMNFAPPQLWVPITAPVLPTFDPFWRSVSREVHANPQLPPAQIDLVNSHRYALLVLLGDVRLGNSFETIRIEPNSSKTVSLDRDAGATIVETIEIRSTAGVWDRQQLVTAVPASAYYDISVYEEHLQSIAIDRTGKSPNPIEDINYVPKSVGWFPLPGGTELPSRATIDVFRRGKEANNPGAVRRLDPKQFDDPPAERPIDAILKEFQSAPRRSF